MLTNFNVVLTLKCSLRGEINKSNIFYVKDTGHLWLQSKTSLLTWCISTYAQNNKPVKIRTQLVVEVARQQKKNTLVTPQRKLSLWSHEGVCFQMLDLGTSKSSSEVSKIKFKYLSGKLLLSQKLCYFRGSRFTHVLYYQQLSMACYQVIFYAKNYFE